VSPFHLLNKLTGFHEIWYEHYSIGNHSNFRLLISYNQYGNMADEQTCEMELTLHHLLQGPELMSVTDL
jgi:hypothetical protein